MPMLQPHFKGLPFVLRRWSPGVRQFKVLPSSPRNLVLLKNIRCVEHGQAHATQKESPSGFGAMRAFGGLRSMTERTAWFVDLGAFGGKTFRFFRKCGDWYWYRRSPSESWAKHQLRDLPQPPMFVGRSLMFGSGSKRPSKTCQVVCRECSS